MMVTDTKIRVEFLLSVVHTFSLIALERPLRELSC